MNRSGERVTCKPSLLERLLFLGLVYTVFFGAYALANRAIAIDSTYDLTTSFDRAIPFVPEFIYPFYLAYVLLPSMGLFIRDRRRLACAAVAAVLLVIGSSVIFLALPVYVPRPEFVPDTFAGRLVDHIYQTDRPVCGFPSLHVSMSLLAALVVRGERVTLGLIGLCFFALTSVAVLLVKQHVIADVVGGVLIGGASYLGCYRPLVRRFAARE